MKLIAIPEEKYNDYRLDVIFNGYKHDPQFLDSNTIAKYALVITEEEHKQLQNLTEKLTAETIKAEQFLNNNLKAAKQLSLHKQTRKELPKMKNYNPEKHIRLMRFDFHPLAAGGWAISEVNSDVPGGFAEASLMPQFAAALFKDKYRHVNFGEIIASEIAKKVKPGGRIALVHCTSYSDDRQVMQFLGDRLESAGFSVIYAAADHLRFSNNKAVSILDGNEGEVDAVFRFTPLEWLIGIKPKKWQGYFDTITPCCNHPVAIFAQTKRFPLVWCELEKAGADLSAWRQLLPETVEVKNAKNKQGFIFKPACGRVGEGISIKEACREDEYEKIIKDVKRHPKDYVSQKKFDAMSLLPESGGQFHVCLGCYSVEGKAAGYYARLSSTPRIDSAAADIAVLIEPDRTGAGFKTVTQPLQDCGREAFKIWAQPDAKWTDWVRPVPFVAINSGRANEDANLTPVKINYLEQAQPDTAVVVDLPGGEGVNEGLSLAQLGLRPVPLYNGTKAQDGAMGLVDNSAIECALLCGAEELKKISLSDNAPPAFLLDSNRINRYKMSVSVFDNSWDLYDQDLPSAAYFLKNGINKIVIRSNSLQKDLIKIFYKFPKKGIRIYFTNGFEKPKEVSLKKPPRKYR